jgi:1,4-dihydroxy-2-naphthoate octaprenyltransferase
MNETPETPLDIWLHAARPRTLPLALACIVMGSFLAAADRALDIPILLLTLATAILLQILSNLANDYGDAIHGADRTGRQGPLRAVQSGLIPAEMMRRALVGTAFLAALAGITLLLAATWGRWQLLMVFVALGAGAIAAAILYTNGKRPYGYAGLGDLAVLAFFGWSGVLGAYVLQAGTLPWPLWLPATSCGLLAVAVLNVNNLRDRDSDERAGKLTLPVRLGPHRGRIYHLLLLVLAFGLAVVFVLVDFRSYGQWLFLITLPRFIRNGRGVYTAATPEELRPYLSQTAILALLFAVIFGLGQIL